MATPATAQILGRRYMLHEELGSGGMGVVYRATDRLTGGDVALKRVHAEARELIFDTVSSSVDSRVALANEFKLLASLRHPRIISVLDYGFDSQGQPFYVMEYLPNARTILQAGEGLARQEQVEMIVHVLQALAYLHRRGILHRDLKPGNVMVVDGEVKVLDFGLSIASNGQSPNSENTVGTLAYMAPELLQGGLPNESTDLFAVGVIAYQLFAGAHPFDTTSVTSLISTILNATPDVAALKLNPQLEASVMRLIAKRPQDRYQTVNEILQDYARATNQPTFIETAATRESFLQAADFVGRDAEMVLLDRALKQTFTGVGSAWLVAGESGVGKSRLLDELRAQALVDGAGVLRGQDTSERGLAYRVWREPLRFLSVQVDLSDFEASVLKPLVPDLDRLLERPVDDIPDLDAQAAQDRLLGVIQALFEQQSQPTVLILEDLHWAGSESLKLLARLSRLTAYHPLFIVASFRDDEAPYLPTELPDMKVIRLERLSEDAIADLSASMLGAAGRQDELVGFLQQETEGNVFFLVEVVRALAEEAGRLDSIANMTLPKHVFSGGVQRIVQRRLGHVREDARPLLELAAVLGRRLDLNVLRVAIEHYPDDYTLPLVRWLTACNNAAVLDVQDDQWRFAHDKLREGVLTHLSEEAHRTLNRRAAELIESIYGTDPSLSAALAMHWTNAQVNDKAVEYLDRAGAHSLAGYAYAEAVEFLQTAAQMDTAPTTVQARERHLQRANRLGLATLSAGMLKESRAYLEEALRLLGHPMPTGKMSLVLSLLRHVARQLRHRVRMPNTVKDPAKREQILESARIYERLAELYFFDNATAPTIYCTIRAANLAERGGPSPEMARTYANLCVATGLIPQRKLADTYARRAKYVAGLVHDPPTEARVLSRTGLYETGNARWEDAQASLERSIQIAEELGDMRQRGEALAILANVHYLMADFERSKRECLDLLDSGRRRGDIQHQSWGYFWGAQAMLRLNEMDEADASLTNGLELVDELLGDSVAQIINYGLLAAARLQQGRMDDAREAADFTTSLIMKVPAPTSFSQFEGYAGATAVYLARLASTDLTVRSTAEELVKAMHRLSKRFPVGAARTWNYQGVLEHLNGDADKAQQAWHQSLQEAITRQMPYEEALAHYQLGRHLPASDSQRMVHLDRAIELFRQLNARYNLAQAELAAQMTETR